MITLAVTIELTDLMLGLLIIAGAVALVGLAVLFFKLAQVMSSVKKLVADITPSVTETVEQLPSVVTKVDTVVGDVQRITDAAGTSVPAMLGDIEVVTGAVGTTVDSVGGAVSGVFNGIQSLFDRDSKPKKAKGQSTVSKIGEIAGHVYGVVSFMRGLQKDRKKKGKKKR